MKTAVAYCRVSTEAQSSEDRFGIEVQRQMITEYAKINEIEIKHWYVDTISGAKDNRPEFDKILEGAVTNPPVEGVIVAKSDRIARDVDLYFGYKYLLKKQSLELISVSEDYGKMGTLAPVYEAFIACLAQIERDNIRIRTSGGRKIKAQQGGYSGGHSPYGYTVRSGKLIVVEEEAAVVREMFELRQKGATLSAITEVMNQRGLKTHWGGAFATSTTQTILNNRQTYEGWYKYGKNGEWVKGQHEAIIE